MTATILANSQTQHQSVDVLLVTATEVETAAVLNLLRTESESTITRRFIGDKTYYDLGVIGQARIFLVQSEMGSGGPGGSLLTVDEAINALSPRAIVMVGIAFGMDSKKQRIGGILVSRQILTYELQRLGLGPEGELVIRSRGDRPRASTRLLDRFQSGLHDWSGAEVEFGLILSGEKLVDNPDFLTQLRRLEPEAIGGEMEGAGLYAAAYRRKVDWILIKAICDWADGTKARGKRQRQQKAAQNAARFILHVLKQGGFAVKSTTTSKENNTAQIRQLLAKSLSDEELTNFCFDYFRAVGENFSSGMSKAQKIQRLLEYCTRHNEIEKLLSLIKELNPAQYRLVIGEQE